MGYPKPKQSILEIAPYKGGGFVESHSNIWGLASNENLLGPSSNAIEAYKKAIDRINRYPEQSGLRVKQKLSELHHLEVDQILLGNGSDEILSLLFRAYIGDGEEVILSENGFFLFPILAKAQGAKIVFAPEKKYTTQIDAILEAVTPKTRIICIANPNNPTGTYVHASELQRLCASVRSDILVIIDSAYAEYIQSNDYTSGVDLVKTYSNVVMTRTLSKIYALAGLRIGWAYASSEVVDIIERIRLAFHVNAIAQEVTLAALDDQEFIQQSFEYNLSMRKWIEEHLTGLGLRLYPTSTNFIVVALPDNDPRTAQEAQKFLLSKNILTRALSLPTLPSFLRITVGPKEAMQALLNAFKEFMSHNLNTSEGKKGAMA